MSETKPDCYKCKYRRPIPRDCHSSCTNTNESLQVAGHPYGVSNGWFCWPLNFDPVWLVSCNGFDPDEVQQLATTGPPTGGTFTLTCSGQTTASIAYNATAADIQSALRALSNIGAIEQVAAEVEEKR